MVPWTAQQCTWGHKHLCWLDAARSLLQFQQLKDTKALSCSPVRHWGNPMLNATCFFLSCKELLSKLFSPHGALRVTSLLWDTVSAHTQRLSGHNGGYCAPPSRLWFGNLSFNLLLTWNSCSKHVPKWSDHDSFQWIKIEASLEWREID